MFPLGMTSFYCTILVETFSRGISEATDLIAMYKGGMIDATTAMQMLSDISGKQPVPTESGGGGEDSKGSQVPSRKRSLEPPTEASSDSDDEKPAVDPHLAPRLLLNIFFWNHQSNTAFTMYDPFLIHKES